MPGRGKRTSERGRRQTERVGEPSEEEESTRVEGVNTNPGIEFFQTPTGQSFEELQDQAIENYRKTQPHISERGSSDEETIIGEDKTCTFCTQMYKEEVFYNHLDGCMKQSGEKLANGRK